MFPISIGTYVKVGCCVLLLGCAWYSGYSFEHKRFTEFQHVVREQAAIQEAKTQQIIEQQKVTTERITNDYQTELNRIHALYNSLLHDDRSISMSKPSNTLISINGFTTDPVFAAQCSATTQQVVSLQQFINEQLTLK